MMYLHAYLMEGSTMASVTSATRAGSQATASASSPCVCTTLRMVSRVVTQLYDDILRPSGLRVTQFSILAAIGRLGGANLKQLEGALAIDQTTLTRSLNLLQRNRLIERAPQADRRIKAMRLTSKGSGALAVARPLWTRAQRKVLGELGPQAWRDTQRRLSRVLGVAVEKRRQGRERRRAMRVRSAPAVRPRGVRGGSAGRTPSPRPPRKRRA
jgi:DNA-binding MarR family transcriptional regulator